MMGTILAGNLEMTVNFHFREPVAIFRPKDGHKICGFISNRVTYDSMPARKAKSREPGNLLTGHF